jgi:hypothetical protein
MEEVEDLDAEQMEDSHGYSGRWGSSKAKQRIHIGKR